MLFPDSFCREENKRLDHSSQLFKISYQIMKLQELKSDAWKENIMQAFMHLEDS